MLIVIGVISLMIFVMILVLSDVDKLRNKIFDLEDLALKGVDVCGTLGKHDEKEYFMGIEHACRALSLKDKGFDNALEVLEAEIKKYEMEVLKCE